jgi:DNA-directed RNA polymerase subunit H (RpoH/RPB5)
MSGTNINVILSIYKSRNTILKHMNRIKYNVVDYEEFSINEIDVMFANSQLDMLLNHVENKTKVYIKYYFWLKQTTKQIRPQNLDNIIDDLYHIDEVLSVNDTLIVIIDEEPNETIINRMKYLYEKDGIFVVIHNIKRLQFDIFEHVMIPKVELMTIEEIDQLKTTLNLKSLTLLPEISRFDPLALAMNLRPLQVIKIIRSSPTALTSDFYRICI